SKDNGDIILKLSKNEISDLVNAVLTKLDDNGSVVALIGEIDGSTQKAAKKKWNNAQKSIQSSLKALTKNKAQTLDFKLILTPDSKKGFSKAIITTNFEDTKTKDLMDFTTTIDMLNYEKVPPMPEGKEIVSKKELDKAISDGLKLYLSSAQ
ncbi:hypothetical protein ACHI6R_06275, partial [Listeria monocytogenes]